MFQIYIQNIVFHHFRTRKLKEIFTAFFKWIQPADFSHVYTRRQFIEMVINWGIFFFSESSCESYLGLSPCFCSTEREVSLSQTEFINQFYNNFILRSGKTNTNQIQLYLQFSSICNYYLNDFQIYFEFLSQTIICSVFAFCFYHRYIALTFLLTYWYSYLLPYTLWCCIHIPVVKFCIFLMAHSIHQIISKTNFFIY